jgi:putative OPT family oligopeptide transporter
MQAQRPPSTTAPLVFGLVLTTVLSGTLTIAGLKAGISPGVSPLVILFAWGAFTRRIAAGGGSLFLNIAQVAGSAGMAVTAGVIFTAPLLQVLHAQRAEPGLAELVAAQQAYAAARTGPEQGAALEQVEALKTAVLAATPPVDVPTLILLSLAGALIGFGFVGLGTRKFLTDPSLPAPEASACRTMIDAAVTEPDQRPRLFGSLVLGLGASFLAPLTHNLGVAKQHVFLWSSTKNDGSGFGFELPFAPIYLGIGGLLTLATAVLVFAGGMLHFTGDALLSAIEAGSPLDAAFPGDSMRWVGGAAMTVAVVWSLAKFASLGRRQATEESAAASNDELLELSSGMRQALLASIGLGTAILVGWLLVADGATPFVLAISAAILASATVMVTLGALLSLQVGSSASPVSGTIFVTTLILCLVAAFVGRRSIEDVALLTPLLVAACVAVCTANDSSQDYKTMQLCGVPVQRGFLAQLLGLVAGCIAVPTVLYVSHEAYVLGSADLSAPQGTLFAKLIDALLLSGELPWQPIAVGLGLGVVAVGVEILGAKRGLLLPSMALTVGIYLPAYLGVGILLGAVARALGEGGGRRVAEATLAAAGLITGAALFELLLGVSILGLPDFTAADLSIASAEELSLAPWAAEGPELLRGLPEFWLDGRNLVGLLGIAVLLGILFFNGRRRSEQD